MLEPDRNFPKCPLVKEDTHSVVIYPDHDKADHHLEEPNLLAYSNIPEIHKQDGLKWRMNDMTTWHLEPGCSQARNKGNEGPDRQLQKKCKNNVAHPKCQIVNKSKKHVYQLGWRQAIITPIQKSVALRHRETSNLLLLPRYVAWPIECIQICMSFFVF